MTARAPLIRASEITSLRRRIEMLAERSRVRSAVAFKTCVRHLDAAKHMTPDARLIGIRHAHNHFRVLCAAIEERAGRDDRRLR